MFSLLTEIAHFASLNFSSVVLLCFTALLFLHRRSSHPRLRLPPGPRGYPIVGVLPLLRGDKVHDRLCAWGRRYGHIFTAWLGGRPVVVLNGITALRECFVKNGAAFSGRPWVELRRVNKNAGIVMVDGPVWREHRRFTLSCLRDFGMGKDKLQMKIHAEAGHLTTALADTHARPCDLSRLYACAVTNIISGLVFGVRFDYEDEFIHRQLGAMHESIRRQQLISALSFFPFLEPLLRFLPLNRMLRENEKLREDYAQEQIDAHRKKGVATEPQDYIDAYLIQLENMKGKHSTFSEPQLRRCIQDLFIVGTETVHNALKWLTLFMALNPEVQTRVQEEIERVVGSDRLTCMADRPQMPYTQATLMEAQRRGPSSLFGAPHATTTQVTVFGFMLPKDTWVFSNLWGINFDPRHWSRPYDFCPDRFIQDGQVVQPEAFVPFGLGPRSCLGENLAKMEIFLFFTAIMQKFRFALPPNAPTPSLDPLLGMNLAPQPFKVCVIPKD